MSHNNKFRSPVVRFFLILMGTTSVVLGVLGMVLPVLPTTPFLLLAAWCYARSSDRFYHWLMNHRIWGKYLRDYTSGKGVPLRIKAWALSLLWITILSTVFFAIDNIWVKGILVVIASIVSVHILSLRTLKPEN